MIIIDKIHEWRYSFKVIIFLVSNYNNMTMNRLQYRHYRNYWYSTHSISFWISIPLHCRHNRRDGVSNHQPYDCLFNCLFRCKSKKISRLRVTGLCEGNSPGTGEFTAQMASNAENVSIWWRHHAHPLLSEGCRYSSLYWLLASSTKVIMYGWQSGNIIHSKDRGDLSLLPNCHDAWNTKQHLWI